MIIPWEVLTSGNFSSLLLVNFHPKSILTSFRINLNRTKYYSCACILTWNSLKVNSRMLAAWNGTTSFQESSARLCLHNSHHPNMLQVSSHILTIHFTHAVHVCITQYSHNTVIYSKTCSNVAYNMLQIKWENLAFWGVIISVHAGLGPSYFFL